jgi:hypothetical protein
MEIYVIIHQAVRRGVGKRVKEEGMRLDRRFCLRTGRRREAYDSPMALPAEFVIWKENHHDYMELTPLVPSWPLFIICTVNGEP